MKKIIYISCYLICLNYTLYATEQEKTSQNVIDLQRSQQEQEKQIREQKLEQNKKEIDKIKVELEQNKKEQSQLDLEVQQLDAQLITAENGLIDLENDLKNKENQIRQTQQELEEAMYNRDKHYEETKERMVTMYKNNNNSFMEIVFSSKNLIDLINRAYYIELISNYDNQVLEEYKAFERLVAEKKFQLDKEYDSLNLIYKNAVIAKESLEEMQKQKNRKLGILETQEEQFHVHIEALEVISNELIGEIKKLTENSTIKYSGGAFKWPVPNNYRISSEYGYRTSPISGNQEFHKGIDIPAPYGTPVLAATDGKVITAGWVNGFGYTIMIDHGDGLTSLYGHNSSLTVSNGEYVKQGEQVAKVGSTGYSTGNHVHFEVRIDGEHTSPWQYLDK
ncbi:hypothetical protein AN396_00715 [Candidatus Epulonipiscium fishelsonii]|uniref:Uncharacterized protein n=1 Tax=Candidatus Epulonipiscium fishelsonii TaxID=77094 RepID=A0ACC8XDG9_9FIRM|nr:hypothetical protein AN396_00715 [Epulopiscium sp. SCG-B11WGA-EpuloA1]